jgi:hypothetical protein
MKRFTMLGLFVFLSMTLMVSAEVTSFDKDKPGQLSKGWQAGVTGRGSPSWSVVSSDGAASGANVLKQSGKGDFPWAAKTAVSFDDGFVEVKFKPISGEDDQAGGLIWRFKDGNNYYVARGNSLENNVSLYYTENGKRKTIKYVDAPVKKGEWNLLRAEFSGKRIKVLLNGKAYIELEDDHITGPGAVGVWTKADSVTEFDDFNYGKK